MTPLIRLTRLLIFFDNNSILHFQRHVEMIWMSCINSMNQKTEDCIMNQGHPLLWLFQNEGNLAGTMKE